ncbi:tryptophan synthase subunit alpha [Neobacillus sp. FSL H8-0543]|uniref:tryptophan synthase subunit alpha n=1 Tax=Neobacillus sp. FSL H8-0543 TaxID=2954672 RepID=UPI003158A042
MNLNKRKQQTFLTGYFVGGDPDIDTSITYIAEAVRNGMDAVEVGIPSMNPFLEGDVITRAHSRAYPHFHEAAQITSFLQKLKGQIDVPIWAMGYYQDVIQSGLYKELTKNQLVDGFIIPDLPLHEALALRKELSSYNVSVIPVINNEMSDSELGIALQDADLVYCQIYQGKTGTNIADLNELPSFYRRIRSLTYAILMAGFGVKSAVLAEQVWNCGFEGVVVGSEIVRLVETQNQNELTSFIQELSKAKN